MATDQAVVARPLALYCAAARTNLAGSDSPVRSMPAIYERPPLMECALLRFVGAHACAPTNLYKVHSMSEGLLYMAGMLETAGTDPARLVRTTHLGQVTLEKSRE